MYSKLLLSRCIKQTIVLRNSYKLEAFTCHNKFYRKVIQITKIVSRYLNTL